MIARLWSAQTTDAQAPAYADHLRNDILPRLKRLDGYAGTLLLKRQASDGVELIVITFWKSLNSIRGFTGSSDTDAAVVADEAVRLLTRFDQRVRHYDLLVQDELQLRPGGSPPVLNT
jgi:heme-degrading monooxygenase HmoA